MLSEGRSIGENGDQSEALSRCLIVIHVSVQMPPQCPRFPIPLIPRLLETLTLYIVYVLYILYCILYIHWCILQWKVNPPRKVVRRGILNVLNGRCLTEVCFSPVCQCLLHCFQLALWCSFPPGRSRPVISGLFYFYRFPFFCEPYNLPSRQPWTAFFCGKNPVFFRKDSAVERVWTTHMSCQRSAFQIGRIFFYEWFYSPPPPI